MIRPSKSKSCKSPQVRHKSDWIGVNTRALCYCVGMLARYSRRTSGAMRLRWITVATAVSLGLSVATTPGPLSAASPLPSGPVDVLSAGSLQDLLQQQIGPAFQKATGYTLNDTSMGSDAIANGIKGGALQGDVFISASPAVNAALEGSANGNWVSWYAEFGSSPLVLGYNPSSRFAHALKTKPWYDVIDQPGFLIGRTDPATDPKGVLAVTALDQAAKAHHIEALKTIAASTSNVYPETSLVGQLQAGQLDAGFFYGVEAAAADIKTVPLTGTDLAGIYTITVLNRAPHEAAARAFLAFLMSKDGQRILKRNGIVAITPPQVSGKSLVPKDLKELLTR
jgi:molybdate/tungstate transport system substrate-binding protein